MGTPLCLSATFKKGNYFCVCFMIYLNAWEMKALKKISLLLKGKKDFVPKGANSLETCLIEKGNASGRVVSPETLSFTLLSLQ